MILIKEIWKDIPEYEGLYQASNLGKIKSLDRFNYKGHHNLEKILKQKLNKNGYLSVSLCKNKKVKVCYIHKLIAITFLDNNNNYPCVNHKDGNKQNNIVDNLEWCSYTHNNNEAIRLKLRKTKPVIQYDKNFIKIKKWDSIANAARILKINPSDISTVCKGKRKTAGGYIWKYESDVIENAL